jgi:hypothetical protein
MMAKVRMASMVGEAGADAVIDWARQDPQGKQLLATASRAQVDRRDLSGYRDVVAAYLVAEAGRDPHRVAEGIRAGGSKAKVQDGRVLVDLEDGTGWTVFTSAIRGNVVGLGKRRS